MMRMILLLLVALTGPFCTFTSASTLVVPTASDLNVTATVEPNQPVDTEKTEEPTTLPTSVPVSVVMEVSATTADAPVVTTKAQAKPEVPETTNTTDPTASTEPVNETETEEPLNYTIINEVITIQENNETGKAEKDVEIEEAMGTGQLVGIVIGALIAVIVVIAVIILVVRRMGQYSP